MRLNYQHLQNSPSEFSIEDFWVIENEFGVHWHYHPEIEICFIKQGTGHRIIGDSIQRFQSGDLVLVGSNLPHCWITDKSFNQSNTKIEVYVIQFPTNLFQSNVKELKQLYSFLVKAQKGIFFDINKEPQFLKLLEKLRSKNGLQKYTSLLKLLETMQNATSKETLASSTYILEPNNKTEQRITLVCNYIQEHYNQAIQLQDLAEIAAMNTSSFSRFFKKKIGKSPINYLNDVRMSVACANLINTKDKVFNIAFDVGFQSVAHFNKLFLNFTGKTPREYRNSTVR
ncbi:AraC family transcriptional regulator [Tenacibaculum xiamenense]|uniref:AraC family transcriptional regulator n=1 Tax=Tenacibaculum xiamenense TaxID=1261553 RepID=UPI0038B4493A